MIFKKTDFETTHKGIAGSIQFTEESLAGLLLRDSRDTELAEQPVEHIERLKKILEILKGGISFFEANWIHTKGPNTGKVVKFQWFNPKHWSLVGKSSKFYADMFSAIIALYK